MQYLRSAAFLGDVSDIAQAQYFAFSIDNRQLAYLRNIISGFWCQNDTDADNPIALVNLGDRHALIRRTNSVQHVKWLQTPSSHSLWAQPYGELRGAWR